MMNKRRFARISIWVTVVLAVMVALQLWSLAGMYHARRDEFARQVMQAMTRAAYDDLLLGNKSSRGTSRVSFSSSGNIDSIRVDMIQEISVKNLAGAGKSISFIPKTDTIHISISDGRTSRFIRQEIRIPSIYALRVNRARYDSLLTHNLASAGIELPHTVDIVRGPTDSLPSAGVHAARRRNDPEVVLTARNDSLHIARPLTFTTPLTTDGELCFRLRIENPDRELLRDMAGVIGSSLMMVAAVAAAFVYLLRTLFRQKTLEEMRLDLTHNVTHELKTPIAVANAANDALLDFGAWDDTVRRGRYLGVIREQLGVLSGLVERILTMSVEEREEFDLHPETFAVGPLLEEVAAKFRLKGRGRAEIGVEVEPAGLQVRADRLHLAHALDNLVDNALKYAIGTVHVRISAFREERWFVVRVSDDGIGIDRAAQPHLFEKFYRVPTGDLHRVKGFGLGLYYVRLVAERHGGTVGVGSRPGAGATFTLKLPLYER